MSEQTHLVEGLLEEITRCEVIRKVYLATGMPGLLAANSIAINIASAQKAIGSGNILKMLQAAKSLQEHRLDGCEEE